MLYGALIERMYQNETARIMSIRNGGESREVIPFPLIISEEVG